MALDTNLIAYYKFDNGAITTDSVGSYTLTNTGTVASTASGKIGYGANFGNPNTTKWLTQTGFTFNSYPLSISGWFYPNIVNDNGNLFSLGEATTNYYQVKLRNTDSHIVFRSNNATDAGDIDTGITASSNTWYHIVVVFNSTTNIDIYVNGVATNTSATVYVAGSLSKFAIGALARSSPIQPYSGIADEVGIWTRALNSTDVSNLYNSGSAFDPITLTTSLISYWKLDESSGNASDSVGLHTLTNSNVTYSTGKINNGAVFNSSSDSLSTSTYTDFNFERTNAFTFSQWLNLTSLSGGSYIIDREDSGTLRGYVFFVQSNGKLRFQIGNNNDGTNCIYVDSTNVEISTGAFYHVVMTYDGSSSASGVKLYVNDSAVATTTLFDNLNATTQNTQNFVVGNRVGGGNDFSGTLDELGVWTRAITAGEVTSLYNAGAGRQYPFLFNYTITAGLGSFVLTGIDVILQKGKGMIAEVGSFILTGIDTSITSARNLTANTASFTLTGINVTMSKGYQLLANVGSFILTGFNAMLRDRSWREETKSNTSTYTKASKSNTDTWINETK